MSLTTRDNVKTSGSITGPGEDARIDLLLTQMDAWVDEFCHRAIEQAAFTEYVAATGVTDKLFLTNPPIDSITSIHESTGVPRVYDSTTLLTADEDYILDDDLGVVHRIDACWPTKVRAVKVIYTGGYATVPKDIERAAIETILYWLEMSRNKLHHLTGEEFGDGEIRGVKMDIPRTALATFQRYQRPLVL